MFKQKNPTFHKRLNLNNKKTIKLKSFCRFSKNLTYDESCNKE